MASVYKQDLQNKSKLHVAEYQKFSLIAKFKRKYRKPLDNLLWFINSYLFYIQILHDKQLQFWPFPNKIKMYSWSPFCVTAHHIKPQLAEQKLQGSSECQMNLKPKGQ